MQAKKYGRKKKNILKKPSGGITGGPVTERRKKEGILFRANGETTLRVSPPETCEGAYEALHSGMRRRTEGPDDSPRTTTKGKGKILQLSYGTRLREPGR